ncbi:hypothetical protein [Candidatus Igneacidithiobacillus taiwanensis]|uniref:hypothetical protein n=1 Tax=Candidatus Igneacidithiobacillus taiwanensis TaxID=1945924 RepID=UPI00289C8C50|nr:hypothetical protein [Candidatus Igneacidithiobacillus taiwanensis]
MEQTLFDDLVQSLKEARAIAHGEMPGLQDQRTLTSRRMAGQDDLSTFVGAPHSVNTVARKPMP